MKNIHLLSTPKPSRLHFDHTGLFLSKNHQLSAEINSIVKGKNIYITNDEEIKKDEYYLGEDNNIYCLVTTVNFNGKKIILTTDQDLIKDGVQAIPDEFLEWFIKNPSCEEVEVKRGYLGMGGFVETAVQHRYFDETKIIFRYHYKIIIQKEELIYAWVGVMNEDENKYIPYQYELKYIYQGEDSLPNFNTKEECQYWCDNDSPFSIPEEEPDYTALLQPVGTKQETLEEAKKYAELSYYGDEVDAFVRGVKWQQEQDKKMYSEEDLKQAFNVGFNVGYNDETSPSYLTFEKWFEQIKKK
jgi:hypothetical protein